MSHQNVGRGQNITLDLFIERPGGERVDADSGTALLDVRDPNDVTVVNNAAPTGHPSVGHYTYTYAVPIAGPEGSWEAEWAAAVGGVGLEPVIDHFTVVDPASLVLQENRIVTVYELQRYMNVSFDPDSQDEAETVIRGVQSALERALNRPITVRQFTERVRIVAAGSNGERTRPNLWLKNAPLVELVSVYAGTTLVDMSTEDSTEWGVREYTGPADGMGYVTVTYRAGYNGRSDEHKALQLAVKRAAQREMTWRADQTQGTVRVSDEGYSAESVQPNGYFTKDELRSLSGYKRRRMSV